MERVDKVMRHHVFKDELKKIENAEVDRVFCKHDITHLLAVARILYILVLEEKMDIKKDFVYAVALLHDIGRYEQYANSIPHNEAGAIIAERILKDCDFTKEECKCAVAAIRNHRYAKNDEATFEHLLYRADKLSRDCFNCSADKECYWDKKLKNYCVRY